MLCDSHIHFIPPTIAEHTSFYQGIWMDKKRMIEFLDTSEINKALLVYPATDAHLKIGWPKLCEEYNASLEAIIEEDQRIIACGIVDLDGNISLQVRHLREEGCRGISIASSQDGNFILEKLKPLFEAAEKNNLAIFVHPQTINPIGFERVKDPLLMPVIEYSFDITMFFGLLMMEAILEKFNVNFIFSSLAGVAPFLKDRFDRVYTMLRKREMVKDLGKLPSQILSRVYVDTSGASLQNVRLAIEMFGEDKVLWGSDYPANINIQESLKALTALDGKIAEKITHKNFLKLFSA